MKGYKFVSSQYAEAVGQGSVRITPAHLFRSDDGFDDGRADPMELIASARPIDGAFTIRSDHPALPGHFPGRPVVPGVVLLDRVAAALARWRGQRIAALPQVKFLAPLLPEEGAELHLDDDGKSMRFSILRNGVLIANGTVTLAAMPTAASGVDV